MSQVTPSDSDETTLEPLPPPGARPARAGRAHLRFQPGLEGLRGLAVAGVLLFHSGFEWARGGFLGVSTFFTLSGYLITSLLLTERSAAGAISLRGFWSRRFRRLLPASFLALGAAVVFGWLLADPGQIARLRGDVIAALLDVANWRFIITGQSYADLFSGPSPVLQFWSLAIEEQFYLVFPLVVAGVVRLTRGSRRALSGVLTVGVVGSIAVCVVLYQPGDDPTRVYYGTGTRAAELLIGALLALTLARPTSQLRRVPRVAWSVIGLVALGLVLLAWHGAQQSDAWLYRGGLAGFAVVSAALIASSLQDGPTRSLLSWRGLRWLGAISYGVYLFHWPVFLWLTPERTHLAPWPLLGLRLAFTFTLADLSFRLLERPIREGRPVLGRPPAHWVPGVAAMIVIGLVAVTAHPPATIEVFAAGSDDAGGDALAQALGDVGATPLDPTSSPSVEAIAPGPATVVVGAPPEPPRRVLLVGDSMALTLVHGFERWNASHGTLTLLNSAWIGCSLTHDGKVKGLNTVRSFSPECKKVRNLWPTKVAEFKPDVVVVLACLFDVSDHRLPGDSTWRPPGDPLVDDYLRRTVAEDADILTAGGATAAFLACPHLDPQYQKSLKGMAKGPYAESDPARVDRLNDVLRDVDRTKPAMRVLDLGAFLRTLPAGELDPALRPDGVHWSDTCADEIVGWLMPQVQRMPALTPIPPGGPRTAPAASTH